MSDQSEIAKMRTELTQLSGRYNELEQTVSKLVEDTANDRKDFGHMKVSLAGLEQSVKEIIDMIGSQTTDIVQKVKKALESVPDKAEEGVKNYVEQVKPKVIKPREESRKKRFLFW